MVADCGLYGTSHTVVLLNWLVSAQAFESRPGLQKPAATSHSSYLVPWQLVCLHFAAGARSQTIRCPLHTLPADGF